MLGLLLLPRRRASLRVRVTFSLGLVLLWLFTITTATASASPPESTTTTTTTTTVPSSSTLPNVGSLPASDVMTVGWLLVFLLGFILVVLTATFVRSALHRSPR